MAPSTEQELRPRAIKADLKGGLCNKLFYLFSACVIAIKDGLHLIEPTFGWKRSILFSDIYDMEFFNEQMKEHFHGQPLMETGRWTSLDTHWPWIDLLQRQNMFAH